MTDNEIVRDFEIILNDLKDRVGNKTYETLKQSFDLINRQKAENKKLKQAINNFKKSKEIHRAEIESLNHDVEVLYRVKEQLKGMYKTAKTEAIKEFAERLKRNHITKDNKGKIHLLIEYDEFDNLVKEMTEGNK